MTSYNNQAACKILDDDYDHDDNGDHDDDDYDDDNEIHEMYDK